MGDSKQGLCHDDFNGGHTRYTPPPSSGSFQALSRSLDTAPIPIPQPVVQADPTPQRGGGGVTFSWGTQNTFDAEKYGEWRDGSGNIIQTGPRTGGDTFDNRYYEQQRGNVIAPAPGPAFVPMPAQAGRTAVEQTARHYVNDEEFAKITDSPSSLVATAVAAETAANRVYPAESVLQAVPFQPPRFADAVQSSQPRPGVVFLPARGFSESPYTATQTSGVSVRAPVAAGFLAPLLIENMSAPANYVVETARLQEGRYASVPSILSFPTTGSIPSLPFASPTASPSQSLIPSRSLDTSYAVYASTPTQRAEPGSVAVAPLKVIPEQYGPQLPPGWTPPAFDGAAAMAAAETRRKAEAATARQASYAPVGRALLNTAWALTAEAPRARVQVRQFAAPAPSREFSPLPYILAGGAVLVGLILVLGARRK